MNTSIEGLKVLSTATIEEAKTDFCVGSCIEEVLCGLSKIAVQDIRIRLPETSTPKSAKCVIFIKTNFRSYKHEQEFGTDDTESKAFLSHVALWIGLKRLLERINMEENCPPSIQ